jgi:hypothetical protein
MDSDSESENEYEEEESLDEENVSEEYFVSGEQHKDFEYVQVIDDDKRRTPFIISPFELAEIISIRTSMIEESGMTTLSDAEKKGLSDARDIAIAELGARKCPLRIRREVSRNNNGPIVEDFNPNEMTINDYDQDR